MTWASSFSGVTCPLCRERLDAAPRNEHGFPLVGEIYVDDTGQRVGNLAREEMGHQTVFCSDGRYALCATGRAV